MAKQQSKNTVYSKLNRAIKKGEIPHISTRTCEHCGGQAEHYHHEDYSKPLDVMPLCVGCHRKIHGANKPTGKRNGKQLQVYMTPEYRGRIDKLARKLEAQGVDLADQRGYTSISKLVRHLVDQELAKSEEEAA